MLKKTFILIIVFSMVVSSAWAVSQEELSQLTGKSKDNIEPGKYSALYSEAFDYLVKKMAESNGDECYKLQIMLQDVCAHASRPGAEEQRAAMATALAAKLAEPGIKPEMRNWIILQIERSGKGEVLPVLTKSLAAADVNERNYAIGALEKNPDAKATDILLGALKGTNDDNFILGLLSALGNRKDTIAAGAVIAKLDSSKPEIFDAAGTALVKLGTAEGTKALKNKLSALEPLSDIAAKKLIDIAENTNDGGLFKEVYGWVEKAEPTKRVYGIRQAALNGMAELGTAGYEDILKANFKSNDPVIKTMAIEAAGAAKSSSTAKYMAGNFETLDSKMLGRLIVMLANRDEPSIAGPIIHAMSSGFADALEIAASVIDKVQTRETAAILIKLLENDNSNVRRIAEYEASISTNKYLDTLLKQIATEGSKKEKINAIKLLGDRKTQDIATTLLGFAKSDDKEIYSAALAALGKTAGYAAIPELCTMTLKSVDGNFKKAGLDAVNAILTSSKNGLAAYKIMIAVIEKANVKDKIELLGTFKMAGEKSAMDYCVKLVKQAGDGGFKEPLTQAALKALTSWSNSMPVKELLELAKSSQYKSEFGQAGLDLAMNMLRVDKNEAKKIAQAVKDANISEDINAKADKIISLR